MPKVLITPRSLTSAPPPALDALRGAGLEAVFCTPGQTPDEAELLNLVPGCVGWLAGVEPVSEAVIEAADALRVISRNGTGTDNLPLRALQARGIAVERAAGANATGVAELTLAVMLAACRHLLATAQGVREGAWPRLRGREIEGSTIGIVGMGAIGRRVAAVLAALGAEVLGYDPAEPDLGDLSGRVRYTPLADLFQTSDILTLHCPLPADGRALLDETVLARVKPGVIIVNTARAGLVDEAAMARALAEQRVACYAADVFAEEPPVDRRLVSSPNVIATSHIGGLTEGSVNRATQVAVDNLLKVLAG